MYVQCTYYKIPMMSQPEGNVSERVGDWDAMHLKQVLISKLNHLEKKALYLRQNWTFPQNISATRKP